MASKPKTKKITLRAFDIENPIATLAHSPLIEHLTKRLENSHVQDRQMVINVNDENKESDVIPHFTLTPKIIKGTMMRIAPKENTPAISEELFAQEKFSVAELSNIETKDSVIYKSHYYFAASNTHIVTNLSRTTSITSLQTYLNWLLEDHRDDFLYIFNPTLNGEDIKLSDITKISVIDTERKKEKEVQQETVAKQKHKLSSLALEALKGFFSDGKDLKDIKDNKIISAELLITFNQPKGMSDVDYQKALGAIIKPMSDIDNTTFHTKSSGKGNKASDFLKMKLIDVELTDSGKPSENQIYQAMEQFLKELKSK